MPLKNKKTFDFKNPIFIGSMIVSTGIVFTFLTKVVDFFRIPDALAATNERVEKLEDTTKQIADVLKEQQLMNKYMHEQKIKDDKEDEQEILSPDGKMKFDPETNTWRKR